MPDFNPHKRQRLGPDIDYTPGYAEGRRVSANRFNAVLEAAAELFAELRELDADAAETYRGQMPADVAAAVAGHDEEFSLDDDCGDESDDYASTGDEDTESGEDAESGEDSVCGEDAECEEDYEDDEGSVLGSDTGSGPEDSCGDIDESNSDEEIESDNGSADESDASDRSGGSADESGAESDGAWAMDPGDLDPLGALYGLAMLE